MNGSWVLGSVSLTTSQTIVEGFSHDTTFWLSQQTVVRDKRLFFFINARTRCKRSLARSGRKVEFRNA